MGPKQNFRWGTCDVRDSTRASGWYELLRHRLRECLSYYQHCTKHEVDIRGANLSQSDGRAPQTFTADLDFITPNGNQ